MSELESQAIDKVQKRKRLRKSNLIVDAILEKIEDKTYVDLLPGIDVLSEEFDVNRKTVNRAILELVEKGTLVRHKGRGTYIAGKEPTVSKKKKQKVNSRRYAFLIDRAEAYSGYIHMLDGCDEVISSIGGLVFYSRFNSENTESLKGRLRSLQTEGVIVCSQIKNTLLKELCNEFNVVTVDYKNPLAHSVTWDNYQAGILLGHEFKNKGFERIISFASHYGDTGSNTNHGQRMKGLHEQLDKDGIEYIEYSFEFTDKAIEKIDFSKLKKLKQDKKTALVIYDVSMLYSILNNLDALKITYSNVASFTDYKLGVPKEIDILVDFNMYQLGVEAATLLLDILGRPTGASRNSVLIPEVKTK